MKHMIPGKRVYIAGPMRGYQLLNFPEFFRVEQVLTDLGYDVFNPARNDGGTTPEEAYELALHNDRPWEHYMRLDIAALTTCDYICLLDEWWTSKGATAEQTVAAWLRIPFLFPDGSEMAVVK